MRITDKLSCSQSGFTLVEAFISLVILGGGLLALATGLSQGMIIMSSSHAHQIAKEKASETMENVFTARDTQKLSSWTQINNVSNGGVFLTDAQPLCAPGPDGLVDTADDEFSNIEIDRQAGPNNIINDDDDIVVTLDNYHREIVITRITDNLKQIEVIITYTVGNLEREYRLAAFISPYA